MKKHLNYIEDSKIAKSYTDVTIKCTCGHSMAMPVFVDEKICNFCGRKVCNKSKAYFKYKMRKELNK